MFHKGYTGRGQMWQIQTDILCEYKRRNISPGTTDSEGQSFLLSSTEQRKSSSLDRTNLH